MSLEQALAETTAAVKALTAALNKGGTGSTGKSTDTKTKVTQEQVLTAITKLRDDFSVEQARAVLKKFGAAKTSELKETDYAKALAAAKAKYDELKAAADEDGADGDDGDDM